MFDAATGALVRMTRVGVGPVQMALDVAARRLYVLNRGPLSSGYAIRPGSVSVLDAATGALVRTTPVGVGAVALTVGARHGRVFALTDDPGATNGQSSGDTSVLDAVTGALVRRLSGVGGTALAVSARAGRLFVASGLSCPPAPTDTNKAELGCLEVLDARTGRRLATRPLAKRVGRPAMAADDLAGHVVAMQEGSRDGQDPDQFVSHLTLFDGATGATLRRAMTNGYWETDAFAVSVTAGRAVVAEGPDAYDIEMNGGGPETISVPRQTARIAALVGTANKAAAGGPIVFVQRGVVAGDEDLVAAISSAHVRRTEEGGTTILHLMTRPAPVSP